MELPRRPPVGGPGAGPPGGAENSGIGFHRPLLPPREEGKAEKMDVAANQTDSRKEQQGFQRDLRPRRPRGCRRRLRDATGRIRTLPPARGLQTASVSERAETKRLTCGLPDDE